jgi:hypothetical protein
MKTFVLSLPKSIQQYSQKLDVYALLCQHSWNSVNEDSSREILLFQRDGKVIGSVNGDTNIYTWQYFAQNNSLLLNITGSQGVLYKFAFCSKDLLVLHKDGTNECLLLVNEKLLDTLGENALTPHYIEQYIVSLESNKATDYTKWWENRKKIISDPYTPAVEPPIVEPEVDYQNYYNSYTQEKQELIEFRRERDKIIASLQNDETYLSLLSKQRERTKSKWVVLIIGIFFIVLFPLTTTIQFLEQGILVCAFFAGVCIISCMLISLQDGTIEVEHYRYQFMHKFFEKYKHCYENCGVDAEAEYSKELEGMSLTIEDRINELDGLMQDLLKDHPEILQAI